MFLFDFLYLAALASAQSSQPTCYFVRNGTITQDSGYPFIPQACSESSDAGPRFSHCCSSGDQCLPQGFCHFSHNAINSLSGYYVGGCTDPNYMDLSCPQECTNLPQQDVVYEDNNNMWFCCASANGTDSCADPTTESFEAPSPEQLYSILSASSSPTASTFSKTAPSSTLSTSTIVTTPTISPTSSPVASLSTGAGAGIGIGLALVVIALGILAFILWRKKRNRNVHKEVPSGCDNLEQPKESVPSLKHPHFYEVNRYELQEISKKNRPVIKMAAVRSPGENE